MRDASTRRRIGLGGANIHAAIDLRRIDAYDLDWKELSQLEGDRALARRGRTHEQNGGRHGREKGITGVVKGKENVIPGVVQAMEATPAARRSRYRPRMKSRSRSPKDNWYHVGRP